MSHVANQLQISRIAGNILQSFGAIRVNDEGCGPLVVSLPEIEV
jgi:hypothetical protein